MAFSSNVTMFTLSGLNVTKGNKYFFFSLALLAYLIMLFFNICLAFTILQVKALHEPMYIFLCNLCINGIYGTSGFFPKFLLDIITNLGNTHNISYSGCLLQVFVIYSSVMCDFSTLTVMAYDRTVAICKPLEYHSIMTTQAVIHLLTFSWLYPFLCSVLMVALTSVLPLCGSQIDKLYCDNWSVVRLSCVPTTLNNALGFIVILSFMAHALFIVYSYKKLITVCTKSKEDKLKFMQTCVPHLVTIINFAISVLFDTMYSRYGSRGGGASYLHNFMSLEFLIIPPLFNPIIYGLNLTELRRRILKPCKRHTIKNWELRRKIRRNIIFS